MNGKLIEMQFLSACFSNMQIEYMTGRLQKVTVLNLKEVKLRGKPEAVQIYAKAPNLYWTLSLLLVYKLWRKPDGALAAQGRMVFPMTDDHPE